MPIYRAKIKCFVGDSLREDDEECEYNPQSDPACPGYSFESSYAYYNEDTYNYGIEEEYFYEEVFFEEPFFEEEYFYEEVFFEPIQEEVFLLVEEFIPIEEFYDPIFEEIEYFLEPLSTDEFITFSYIEDDYLIFDELPMIEYDLPVIEDVLMEHFEHEQIVEAIEEYYEEEVIEEEVIEEEVVDEEIEVLADDDKKDDKLEMQLSVVADTIKIAANSYGGINNGVNASNYSLQNSSTASAIVSNTQSNAVASSVSGGVASQSNSPSISDQVTSSAAQTQQVLSMSVAADTSIASSQSSSVSDTSVDVSITPMMSFDANQPVMADVQIQDMQG